MSLTCTDQFCGAGGSSLGAVAVTGVSLRLGLNHSELAIQTHSENFPDADHDCTDISACDPRRYPSTDILLTSPECTNHSLAKGSRRRPPRARSLFDDGPLSDEAAERSRATMWDVVRFAELHAYKIVIVENVVDAFWWGPPAKGFPAGDGSLFDAWLRAMDALGYRHRVVFLNSMFAPPTPQSRDRMYVVFWRKGQRVPALDFNVTAWCPDCERVVDAVQTWKRFDRRPWGRYGAQYVYGCPACRAQTMPGAFPAATAIDWTLTADRIGDRKRPLAAATRERIRRGLERYGLAPQALRTLHDGGSRPLTVPFVTQTARQDLALLLPVAGNRFERRAGSRVRTADDPLATVTATPDKAIVVPLRGTNVPADADEAQLPTVCAGGNHLALAFSNMHNNLPRNAAADPLHVVTTGGKLALVVAKSQGSVARSADEPMQTLTTIPQPYLLEGPDGLVLSAGGRHAAARDVAGESLPTVVGSDRLAFVVRQNTSHGDPGQMCTPVVEPLRTLTAAGHQSLVVPYYTGEAKTTDEPIGTVTSRDRYALLDIEELIDDCTFRMLQPHEIARAMVMHEHVDGSPYVVLGNKRDQVAQYGNAVTPPVMRMLLERCVASLEPA